MKAAQFSQFGGPEVLEIVDIPQPHPASGQIRIAVRAAGVNASDWKKRQGLMDQELPQTMGYEAAGIVDELGEDVTGVAIGDRVFGFSGGGSAQAESAVLDYYAPIPSSLDFAAAAALPAVVETAARGLDQLGVGDGSTVLINGASGSVGSAAVQLAVARGARVVGTGSPGTHDYLRTLGAEPVAYGDQMTELVRAVAPTAWIWHWTLPAAGFFRSLSISPAVRIRSSPWRTLAVRKSMVCDSAEETQAAPFTPSHRSAALSSPGSSRSQSGRPSR